MNRTEIYKILIQNGFVSKGKNDIKHSDIVNTFTHEKDIYVEIYKEVYGFSIHIYGQKFMSINGIYPTTVDIMYKKDLEELRQILKRKM